MKKSYNSIVNALKQIYKCAFKRLKFYSFSFFRLLPYRRTHQLCSKEAELTTATTNVISNFQKTAKVDWLEIDI